MDREDRKRNLQHVQQLRLALRLPPSSVIVSDGCQHLHTAVAKYTAKHGGYRWVEMCLDDGQVTHFNLSTQAAQRRALELSPIVQDYIPNPELAYALGPCSLSGCDRIATMLHHLEPEHIVGQIRSRDGGTIPVCADCHAMLHRSMKSGG